MTTYNIQLTSRDLALVQDVARYKFLSTAQLHALHFANSSARNAANRLAALTRGEILSRVFAHPRVKGTEKSHPIAVYYFSAKNQKRLKSYLEADGKISEWQNFEEILEVKKLSHNKDEEFSILYLFHELGISDFFIELEKAEAAGHFKIIFWERTSPFAKEVGKTLKVTVKNKRTGEENTEQLYFNPDGFFCLQQPSGAYSFYFLELDNDTELIRKFRKKLYAYIAYQKQKHFYELVKRYMAKYRFTLTTPEKAGFRVLTVTPHERRSAALFSDSLKLSPDRMFLFTTLPTSPHKAPQARYGTARASSAPTAPNSRA